MSHRSFATLAVALLPLAALAAPADPAPTPYSAGYQAGYQAAMAAAKQALAEGRALEAATAPAVPPAPTSTGAAPVPDAASGAGPVSLPTASAVSDQAGEPPDWWNHSSLRYALRSDAWRHGLQAQLSGASLSGNEEGSAWRGGGKLNSRLGRWTNELSATIDKRDIASVGGAKNVRDYRMLQESLRYDLTERGYLAGGFIHERDDMALIDSRLTTLAGAGYYWLDNDRFRLNTYLGLGRVDERYMEYVRDHVGIEQRDSGLLYLYETLEWRLSENWGLRQGFRLMQDLDKSGHYVLDPVASAQQRSERYRADSQVKRYRTIGAIDLDYRLGPRSTVSLGVESRFDSNPWPDVIRRDRTRRLTFNIMF